MWFLFLVFLFFVFFPPKRNKLCSQMGSWFGNSSLLHSVPIVSLDCSICAKPHTWASFSSETLFGVLFLGQGLGVTPPGHLITVPGSRGWRPGHAGNRDGLCYCPRATNPRDVSFLMGLGQKFYFFSLPFFAFIRDLHTEILKMQHPQELINFTLISPWNRFNRA